MYYRFDTRGPLDFKLGKPSEFKGRVKQLFPPDKEGEDLGSAVGVYIIAVKKKSKLFPWYVGKTDVGFRKRFLSHSSTFQKLAELSGSDDFKIFVIPRITPTKAKFKRGSRKTQSKHSERPVRGLPSVEALENLLIGACLTVNKDVTNRKKVSLHKEMHVPGFLNDGDVETDSSALALRAMLEVK
jgi:hypothetical protein